MRDIHLAIEADDVAWVVALVRDDPTQVHLPWSADNPDQPLHLVAYAAWLLDHGAQIVDQAPGGERLQTAIESSKAAAAMEETLRAHRLSRSTDGV